MGAELSERRLGAGICLTARYQAAAAIAIEAAAPSRIPQFDPVTVTPSQAGGRSMRPRIAPRPAHAGHQRGAATLSGAMRHRRKNSSTAGPHSL